MTNFFSRKSLLYWLDFNLKNVTRLLIISLIFIQIWLSFVPLTIFIIGLRIVLFCISLKILALLSLYWLNPPTSAFMLQTANPQIEYNWVNYEQINPWMFLAVIVAEDPNFSTHSGFYWRGIFNAWKANSANSSSSLRGGSSISQQTIKNLFLWPKQTYFRKLLEAYLTIIMEAILSKKRILEIYLNIIQFAPHIFGVEAASRYFFQKNAQQLTVEEASLLAAVLPNPYIYHINNPSEYVKEKQKTILNNMKKSSSPQLIPNFLKPKFKDFS